MDARHLPHAITYTQPRRTMDAKSDNEKLLATHQAELKACTGDLEAAQAAVIQSEAQTQELQEELSVQQNVVHRLREELRQVKTEAEAHQAAAVSRHEEEVAQLREKLAESMDSGERLGYVDSTCDLQTESRVRYTLRGKSKRSRMSPGAPDGGL